MIAKKIVFRVI